MAFDFVIMIISIWYIIVNIWKFTVYSKIGNFQFDNIDKITELSELDTKRYKRDIMLNIVYLISMILYPIWLLICNFYYNYGIINIIFICLGISYIFKYLFSKMMTKYKFIEVYMKYIILTLDIADILILLLFCIAIFSKYIL